MTSVNGNNGCDHHLSYLTTVNSTLLSLQLSPRVPRKPQPCKEQDMIQGLMLTIANRKWDVGMSHAYLLIAWCAEDCEALAVDSAR